MSYNLQANHTKPLYKELCGNDAFKHGMDGCTHAIGRFLQGQIHLLSLILVIVYE